MSTKLYVGNLLYEVDDNQLRDIFSQFGNVVAAQVIRYRDSGRSKGFGFVEFDSEEAAQKAIDALNGQDHQGRRLVVSEARPMQPRENRGPRGGGGGRGRFGGGDRGGYRGGNRGGYDSGDSGMGGDDMGGDMGGGQM
jgi:RNA recognition motif-containing protein